MNNEDQVWNNCGQVFTENGLLLTVLSADGGARRSIQVEADFMSLLIDLTPDQVQELGQALIAPPLTDESDEEENR